MADNIKYRFIQNVGDYFPSGYFSDDFFEKVQKCAGISNDEVKDICSPYVRLKQEYNDYKNFIINDRPRVEDAIKKTHDFHTRLLSILGYQTDHAYQEHCVVNDESTPVEMIPVRHVIRQGCKISYPLKRKSRQVFSNSNTKATNVADSRNILPANGVLSST